MAGSKYRYNLKTLSYERIEPTLKGRMWQLLSFVATGGVFAVFFVILTYMFFDSPKEKMQKREIENLRLQLELMNKDLSEISAVMEDIQYRDNNIYRVIFEAEPIPENVRKAGFGGVNRYKYLEGYENSELLTKTQRSLDTLKKQLYIQSKSFDEVFDLAKNKEKMLVSIPSIQPVANKDLKKAAGGYGMRIHPILKIPKFHYGMDFTAKVGTEIYTTGDGVVKEVESSIRGYGNKVVIDHGFGYQTLYAHLSKFNVKRGQKVKRGDVIGYVGNTGFSSGPHLHYEVLKNGKKVNPINFYFNDLSPEEYDRLIEISSSASQSFD
jgi:murein DD-endopeptidase MepM/ murein hydrolase activator NlpD